MTLGDPVTTRLFTCKKFLAREQQRLTCKIQVVDKECASFYVESHPEKLPERSRGCVLACGGKEGFGIISDGRFYPFQKNGNLTRQWLEKSSKEKDLRVIVW
jgi:hypothetical protein